MIFSFQIAIFCEIFISLDLFSPCNLNDQPTILIDFYSFFSSSDKHFVQSKLKCVFFTSDN